MLVNRIGDICLLIGIACIMFFFGTVNYFVLEGIINYYFNMNFNLLVLNLNIIDFICLFLFLGAMGKSAQLFLHV
jgi:NADH-quinone oxidoreductase subunit L